MTKTLFAKPIALIVVTFGLLAMTSGCHSDPHDTHIRTGVASPR